MCCLGKDIFLVFSAITFAIFAAILTLFIGSKNPGCVAANEFDKEVITIYSNPVADGISGFGSSQVASWHDTGLKSNGGAVSLEITGSWVPWYGNDDFSSNQKLNDLSVCKFCAKNDNIANCICYKDQVPNSEDGYAANDCSSNIAAQEDPTKCTCTKQHGLATDYGIYHYPLGFYDKNHNVLKADDQNICKYNAGMGLYLGLFGNSGAITPIRVYHLFSENAVCDVVKNSQGKCLDEAGNDVTKYIFNSANSQAFVKNDNDGNQQQIDPNPGNDTLHARNEVVKMIILDSRYDDNFGSYQVSFLSGVGNDEEKGLLEYLVRIIEDQIMGKPDDNGVRQGGVIQSMFNHIVQDSGFVSILQISLSLYIIFFGVSVLLGLVEVNKKELMSRMLKIALVIFFTSSTSWYFYNDVVVKFFKDSMDYVISIFMSFSDQNIDPSSGIITAQMDRAANNTNATRFSYADLIIRNLLSSAAAKKIFGLLFGVPLFGLLYIALIYMLIAFFVYVMLNVAMAYVVAMIKLAFVLALGPIFISFTLFSHTNDMFKNWLAFLATRSLEIIMIFLVLYNFLVLIDQRFTALLYYKACVSQLNLGFFSIPILKSYVSRSLADWLSSFMVLGGLIFVMQLVLEKVPDLAASLVNIGGTAGKGDSGGNSFKAGGALLGGMIDVAKSIGSAGVDFGASMAGKAIQGMDENAVGRRALNSIGSGFKNIAVAAFGEQKVSQIGNAAGKALSMLPSNPRAMYRNSFIDSAIAKAQKQIKTQGLTGKDADRAVRAMVVDELIARGVGKGENIYSNPSAMAAAGLNLETINKRMDEKLIAKPLLDFIKTETKNIKESGNHLIGKAMRDELDKRINNWADNNLIGGRESIRDIMSDKGQVVDGFSWGGVGLRNMSEFIRSQTEYTAAEAATYFANNPEKQREYLQHLKDNEFRLENDRKKQSEIAVSKSFNKFSNAVYDKLNSVTKAIKPLDNLFGSDSIHDPKRAAASFARKVGNEESKKGTAYDYTRRKTGSWLKYNQGSALNPFNLAKSKAAINQDIKESERSGLIGYLGYDGAQKERDKIKAYYEPKEKEAPNGLFRSKIKAKKDEKLKDSQERRKFFKDQLKQNAIKSALKDSSNINDDLKKIRDLEKANRGIFIEQSRNYINLDKDSSQRKRKNELLEDTKQKNIREIIDLKLKTKSLEEIVEEIKKLEASSSPEEKARAKDLKAELSYNLQKEYNEALIRQLERQKEFLSDEATRSLAVIQSRIEQNIEEKAGEEKYARYSRMEDATNLSKELQRIVSNTLEQGFKDTIVDGNGDKKLELKDFDQSTKDSLLKHGGADALIDGLTNIAGKDARETTLFEKSACLEYYEQNFDIRGTGANIALSSDSGVSNVAVNQPNTANEAVIDTTANPVLPSSAALPQEPTKTPEEIKTDMEEKIKKSQSISDDLDHLDKKKEENKTDKSLLKNLLSIQINAIDSQLSSVKSKISQKKAELSLKELQLLNDPNNRQIEKAIDEIKGEIQSCDSQISDLAVKKSSYSSDLLSLG
ncbi:MAG: type IV secretion system protein [Rickettsiales bacterium]|nr:type IV secretion system protein [Rickettsiales bacterium]